MRVELLDWLHRTSERLLLMAVWRLPRTLVMWCAIRLMAHATTGRWADTDASALSITEALRRWDQPNT